MHTPQNQAAATGAAAATAAAADADPWAVFAPPAATLQVAGRSVDVSPLRLGEVPAVARALAPLAAMIAGMVQGQGPDAHQMVNWAQAIGQHGAAIIAAIAAASRTEPAWVEQLELDSAAELGQTLVNANADFFMRRLLPKLQASSSSRTPPASTGPVPYSG
jgi:hypothetical protein